MMLSATNRIRTALLAVALVPAAAAGCARPAAPPAEAGPAPPSAKRERPKPAPAAVAPATEARAAAAPPALPPDSFDALKAEALGLAAETRRRHGDSAATIDLEASMHARFGDLAAAVGLWEAWLADHPDTPEAHVWLGKLARERGDDAGAIDHFRTAFDARPDLPGAQVLLGAALVNGGRAAEAAEVLAREYPATAGNPNRSILLGHALLETGDAEGARRAFERAVAQAPGSAHALFGLANACARLGDAAEAARLRAVFAERKARGLENDRTHADGRLHDLPFLLPVAARWYAAAGRIEVLHGDPAAAEARWLRAVQLDPAQREAVAELDRAWRRAGRAEEAARLVARAREQAAAAPAPMGEE